MYTGSYLIDCGCDNDDNYDSSNNDSNNNNNNNWSVSQVSQREELNCSKRT
jgi:hypothetical protein